MKVTVQYFAILREQRGLSEEVVETSSRTFGELYEELAQRHRFTLPGRLVKAAVRLEFCPIETQIAEGDTVVFIPPVAGG